MAATNAAIFFFDLSHLCVSVARRIVTLECRVEPESVTRYKHSHAHAVMGQPSGMGRT